MRKIPESLQSTWRTVQVFKIVEGINQGLGLFIVSPYFYQIFQKFGEPTEAFYYTSILVAINFGLIAFFEIPTGALADTFGRVRTILFSLILSAFNGVLVIALFFFDYFPLIIIIALITRILGALTFTLQSGTFSAWMVDSMREQEPGFGFDRLLARGYALSHLSMVFGGVLGITTYLYGVPYIAFLIMVLLRLGCLSYCLTSMEESRHLVFFNFEGDLWALWKLMKTHTVKTIKTSVTLCRENKIIQWLIVIFVGYTFLYNIVSRLWPIALGGQFGIEKWSYEWYAMVLIIPVVTAWASHRLARRGDKTSMRDTGDSAKGLCQWLFVCSYLSAVAILLLGWVNSQGIINFPVFFGSILIVEASFGIVKPAFESLICHYMPAENAQERATILSVGSALRCFLVLIFIVPSRGASDALSPVGWMLPASILLIIGIVAHLKIRVLYKKEHVASSPIANKEKLYDPKPAN